MYLSILKINKAGRYLLKGQIYIVKFYIKIKWSFPLWTIDKI